jgi:hypothetical protein
MYPLVQLLHVKIIFKRSYSSHALELGEEKLGSSQQLQGLVLPLQQVAN